MNEMSASQGGLCSMMFVANTYLMMQYRGYERKYKGNYIYIVSSVEWEWGYAQSK
jgi:hypothetical protein